MSPGGAPVLRGVDLAVGAGSFTALAGPSGVGKTTLLRAIAGLEEVSSGTVSLGGRDLEGVPVHRRRVAYLFQTPRLFPNLDVAGNVAFRPRMDGSRREERRRRAAGLLAEVGLSGFGDRSTRGLSGGEAQRVALARALSGNPDLLLLDEPLASVDPERREALRRLIRRLHDERGITTVYVTHDRTEAAELGDRVALLLDGRVVQHDVPEAMFERPLTPGVARFFGSRNVLEGEVEHGTLAVAGTRVSVPGPDGHATFTIRPERVRLDPAGALRARVQEATYLGTHVRTRLDAGGVELEAHLEAGGAPAPGTEVRVALPAGDLWRFPDPAAAGAERSPGIRSGS